MPASRMFVLAVLLFLSAVLFVSTGPKADELKESSRTKDLPPGELGKFVALGRDVVQNTNMHPLSRSYVGNALTCSSCHLNAGTDPKAASFLGTATAYPAWSPRERRVITLEDRVLNCFMRSMNGVRPPNGSEVSVAITTYITWLSSGERMRMNPDAPLGPKHVKPLSIDALRADSARGKALYADHCASCHGDNGTSTEDWPPVWGDESYNNGAGLSHVDKLAAWLKVAMPLDDPYLSEQQALDIAAFINSQPRPKFVLEEHLPKSQRPDKYPPNK